jgi:uncharacterized membrane protein YphA (DoxX/SURF4 family)
MTTATLAGVQPWLPPPLSRSAWWTAPIAAERLAALRVGAGLALLCDVLVCYAPRAGDFFGTGSLNPGPAAGSFSPLAHLHSAALWQGVLAVWAGAALLLALGVFPRTAAGVAWFLSVAVARQAPTLHNSGDNVRNILLFYLMLCPCGAAWSAQAWLCGGGPRGQVRVHPWPVRLLFVQLALIYFMNGLYKLGGGQWHGGTALADVINDAGWTRWPMAGWPQPAWLLQAATWGVLAWEVGFPLFVLVGWMRGPALAVGVLFHVGTGLTMRLGPFPLYMLCLYLPLVPWERLPLTRPAPEGGKGDGG